MELEAASEDIEATTARDQRRAAVESLEVQIRGLDGLIANADPDLKLALVPQRARLANKLDGLRAEGRAAKPLSQRRAELERNHSV